MSDAALLGVRNSPYAREFVAPKDHIDHLLQTYDAHSSHMSLDEWVDRVAMACWEYTEPQLCFLGFPVREYLQDSFLTGTG